MMATVVITLIIAALVGLIIVNKIKKSKDGQRSCGCGCSGCSMSDVCHKK